MYTCECLFVRIKKMRLTREKEKNAFNAETSEGKTIKLPKFTEKQKSESKKKKITRRKKAPTLKYCELKLGGKKYA